MILPAILCPVGWAAGFLLLRRVPTCSGVAGGPCPRLSIVIPARNEERNLPRLLASIAASSIPTAEVVVIDDESTDATAAVAGHFKARVIAPGRRPPGWTGKSWACLEGARASTGELLLFLDADTYLAPGGLERIIAHWTAAQDDRLVVSLLPYYDAASAHEQLSLFFNIVMAAGAGGFGAARRPRLFGPSLLLSRKTYFEAGGHAAVPGVVLENLRWARDLQAQGARLQCFGGRDTLHTRMSPGGLARMTESWAKACLQGAQDSGPGVVLLSVAWMAGLWSTLLLVMTPLPLRVLVLVYLLFALQLHRMGRWLGGYRTLTSLLFPIPLAYFCIVFGYGASRRALGGRMMWRGREV